MTSRSHGSKPLFHVVDCIIDFSMALMLRDEGRALTQTEIAYLVVDLRRHIRRIVLKLL